jgi:hypothetical protein
MGNVEKKDTTYSLSRSTAFNARVEPIWMHFSKTKNQRGMIGSFFEKRRVKSVIASIHDGLRLQKAADGGNWDREDGECAANIKVPKMGFFQELRDALRRKLQTSQQSRVEHFTRVREWNALYIPVDFSLPFEASGVPIGSAVRLQEELKYIGQLLGLPRHMNAERMPPFMQMKIEDIAKADEKAASDRYFWPSFSFCILKKLADVSIEKNLPIVFA